MAVVRYREAMELAGVPPTRPFANVGYLQAMEIAEGLRACGFPCRGADMQRALDGLRFDTEGFASGSVGFSTDNHEALDTVSFYVWDEASRSVVEAAAGVPAGGPPGSQ